MDVHAEDSDILIAELPAVGGRLVELMQPHDDGAEAVLASESTRFFVPVPTREMREVITGHRARTFANPRNEQETKDAPVHLVEGNWVEARQAYNAWNGIGNDPVADAEYSPEIYRAVYERLLRFRHCEILVVDRSFEAAGSAHERGVPVSELAAGPGEVEAAFAAVGELFPGPEAEKAADGWADY